MADGAKITNLADLRKLKQPKKPETSGEAQDARMRVVVGLGTCGIAAGGRAILERVVEELAKRGAADVSVETMGCIGLCPGEPLMEVIGADGSRVTYGNLTPQDIPRIVDEHILGGRVVADKILDTSCPS